MRVIIVEDERKVREFIRSALEQSGFTVDAVASFDELIDALQSIAYDAVVLDRLLKAKDSIEGIPEIKKVRPSTRILVLSALSEVDDKVNGLNLGADDYLGKPFHVSELIARLHAIVGRSKELGIVKGHMIEYGDLKIDLSTQRVTRSNRKIELTGKEYRVLCLLAKRPGQIYSKTSLLDQVWDLNHYPESNVVEVVIANLRSKLDKEFEKKLIHSKRSAGYWFGEP